MARREVTRREVLAGLGVMGASVLPSPTAAERLATLGSTSARAKNIIFCVSDGMSTGTLTMVDHLTQIRDGKRSYWSHLLSQRDVVNGLQDTRSLNSLVTDSSAAASAWGCGRRIWNGQVNMYPDGTRLRTLTQLLGEQGMRRGLVTTATITHATPAGFSVNCKLRDDQNQIAVEYLASGIELLLGGGRSYFDPAVRSDKRDLLREFADMGYHLPTTAEELRRSPSGKLLGLFGSSHLPYSVDRDHDTVLTRTVPTLAEMSQIAIERLDGGSEGFVLQIEGAKIDHAAHGNDLAGLIYDQMAFEDAIAVAVDFARRDRETLVVITSDHGNANPGLNAAGDEYIDSTPGLEKVFAMRSTYGPILAAVALSKEARTVKDAVQKHLSIELTNAEAAAVAGAANSASPFKDSIFFRGVSSTLGMVLGNHTKVTWTSGNHTSDHVLVTALGPGKEMFGGVVQNHAMFDSLLALRGLRHENPRMTFEQAAPLYQKMRGRDGLETEALHWE